MGIVLFESRASSTLESVSLRLWRYNTLYQASFPYVKGCSANIHTIGVQNWNLLLV